MNRRTSACLRDLYKITQHKKEQTTSSEDDRKNPKQGVTEISTVPTRPVKLKRSGNLNYPTRCSADRADSKTSVPTASTTHEEGTAASSPSYYYISATDRDGSSVVESEEAFGSLTMLNPRATKRARRERPRIRQKPGLTAKGEARKFVKHNYTDHSHETHHVIPDNDDSIFENYLDFKETHIKQGVLDDEGKEQPSDHADGNAMSKQVVESAAIKKESKATLDAVVSNPASGLQVSSGKSIETISKIFGSKKLRTAPFPLKLHVLLYFTKENGLSNIVSWLEHGRAFRIFDTKQFEEVVMSRFFTMRKITSFHRQLNLYGFRRLTHGKDEGAYYHEYFLRGKPYLTVHITRTKVKGTKIRAASSPDEEPDFYTMPFVNAPSGAYMVNPVQPKKLSACTSSAAMLEMVEKPSRSSSSNSMKDKRDRMNDLSMRRKGGVYNGPSSRNNLHHKEFSSEKQTETTVLEVKSTPSCYNDTADRCLSPLPFSEPATRLVDPVLPLNCDDTESSLLKRKSNLNQGVNEGVNEDGTYSMNSVHVQPLAHGTTFQVPPATSVQYLPHGTQYVAYECPQNFQPQEIILQQQQQYYTYYTPVAHQSSVPSMQKHSYQGFSSSQYVPAHMPDNQHSPLNTTFHGINLTSQQMPQQELQQQPQQQQFHTLDFVTRRSSLATSYNESIAETCETGGPVSQSDHILDALTEDMCTTNDDDDYRNDLAEQFNKLEYDSLSECNINEEEATDYQIE